MELYKKIISGIIISGIGVLSGCVEKYNQKEELVKSHFGSLPLITAQGMAMVTGDFDNDGDLDLIVGSAGGELYLLNNDGKGNFSLKMYKK